MIPWLMAGAAAIAFAVRLESVLRGGGLFGPSDYDGAVYFTGSDSLLSGRIPYKDFVLLHPPGILLILMPFAAIGRVFSDPTGFAAARVFFMLVGAFNAALLTKLGGRLGTAAAVFAGLFYALWYPSLYAERTTLLEPLGTTALLVALLVLWKVGPGKRPTDLFYRELLAGAAVGLGASIKIWGIVLVAVVVAWQIRAAGWQAATRVAAGAAAAVTSICLPFFLLAPGPMIHMVVRDQIGRPVNNGSFLARLASISSLNVNLKAWGNPPIHFAIGVFICLTAGAALVVWRQSTSRILVVLLATTSLTLFASPSYYRHYGEFVAAPLVLALAAAAQQLANWVSLRLPSLQVAARALIMAPLLLLAVAIPATTFGHPSTWPDRSTTQAIPGCVVADDPTALIELNILSSDLRKGCTVWVDATGLTYDRAAELTSAGRHEPQLRNLAWQRALVGYLTSGKAAVILRHPASEQLTIPNLREITEGTQLVSNSVYRIFGRPG